MMCIDDVIKELIAKVNEIISINQSSYPDKRRIITEKFDDALGFAMDNIPAPNPDDFDQTLAEIKRIAFGTECKTFEEKCDILFKWKDIPPTIALSVIPVAIAREVLWYSLNDCSIKTSDMKYWTPFVNRYFAFIDRYLSQKN